MSSVFLEASAASDPPRVAVSPVKRGHDKESCLRRGHLWRSAFTFLYPRITDSDQRSDDGVKLLYPCFLGVPVRPIFLLPVFVVRIFRNLSHPFEDFFGPTSERKNTPFKTESEFAYKENGEEFFYKPGSAFPPLTTLLISVTVIVTLY